MQALNASQANAARLLQEAQVWRQVQEQQAQHQCELLQQQVDEMRQRLANSQQHPVSSSAQSLRSLAHSTDTPTRSHPSPGRDVPGTPPFDPCCCAQLRLELQAVRDTLQQQCSDIEAAANVPEGNHAAALSAKDARIAELRSALAACRGELSSALAAKLSAEQHVGPAGVLATSWALTLETKAMQAHQELQAAKVQLAGQASLQVSWWGGNTACRSVRVCVCGYKFKFSKVFPLCHSLGQVG